MGSGGSCELTKEEASCAVTYQVGVSEQKDILFGWTIPSDFLVMKMLKNVEKAEGVPF